MKVCSTTIVALSLLIGLVLNTETAFAGVVPGKTGLAAIPAKSSCSNLMHIPQSSAVAVFPPVMKTFCTKESHPSTRSARPAKKKEWHFKSLAWSQPQMPVGVELKNVANKHRRFIEKIVSWQNLRDFPKCGHAREPNERIRQQCHCMNQPSELEQNIMTEKMALPNEYKKWFLHHGIKDKHQKLKNRQQMKRIAEDLDKSLSLIAEQEASWDDMTTVITNALPMMSSHASKSKVYNEYVVPFFTSQEFLKLDPEEEPLWVEYFIRATVREILAEKIWQREYLMAKKQAKEHGIVCERGDEYLSFEFNNNYPKKSKKYKSTRGMRDDIAYGMAEYLEEKPVTFAQRKPTTYKELISDDSESCHLIDYENGYENGKTQRNYEDQEAALEPSKMDPFDVYNKGYENGYDKKPFSYDFESYCFSEYEKGYKDGEAEINYYDFLASQKEPNSEVELDTSNDYDFIKDSRNQKMR